MLLVLFFVVIAVGAVAVAVVAVVAVVVVVVAGAVADSSGLTTFFPAGALRASFGRFSKTTKGGGGRVWSWWRLGWLVGVVLLLLGCCCCCC